MDPEWGIRPKTAQTSETSPECQDMCISASSYPTGSTSPCRGNRAAPIVLNTAYMHTLRLIHDISLWVCLRWWITLHLWWVSGFPFRWQVYGMWYRTTFGAFGMSFSNIDNNRRPHQKVSAYHIRNWRPLDASLNHICFEALLSDVWRSFFFSSFILLAFNSPSGLFLGLCFCMLVARSTYTRIRTNVVHITLVDLRIEIWLFV